MAEVPIGGTTSGSGAAQRKTRENDKARKSLLAAGVEVRDSSAAFALTHQKSMVIDEDWLRGVIELGAPRSHGDPRLCGHNGKKERSRGNGWVRASMGG